MARWKRAELYVISPWLRCRAAILVINPHKLRMSPLLSVQEGVAQANVHEDWMAEWRA